MIKNRKIINLILLIFFTSKEYSYGDGFLQEKGKILFINSVYISRFKGTDPETGGLSGSYVGSIMNINYIEYGLFKRITIGAKIIARDYFQDKNGDIFGKRTQYSSAISGIELFARNLIFEYKFFVLSFFSMIKFPGYYFYKGSLSHEYGDNLRSFETQNGFELGISIDKKKQNTQVYNAQSPFFTVGLYHRTNFKTSSQMIYNFTLGLPFYEKFLILFKFNKITYLFFNQNYAYYAYIYGDNSLFAIAELYLSFLVKIKKNINLEIGYKMSLHNPVLATMLKRYYDNTIFFSIWIYSA